MPEADGLPETVRSGIDAFAAAAREAFAPDLVSLVLFGSAAEGRLRPTSDVNLVVVLRDADPARLEAVGSAYRLARATIRLSAMFLLESEIAAAAEAFAVKFADIVQRHRVLFGPDPFAGLAVDRAAALHRLRQVLVNLTLRLRERLVMAAPFPEQLALAAADAVGPLRAAAATLLGLETGEAPPHPREALAGIVREGGLEDRLALLNAARETGTAEAGGIPSVAAAIAIAQLLQQRADRLE
jgi:predicted nucleotidyltransferase